MSLIKKFKDRQDVAEGLVRNHVMNCVSYLVAELVKHEEYQEDLWKVCSRPYTDEGLDEGEEQDDYEGEEIEALEHWVVSDWLASRLKDRGEMVVDFYGLTIWGRTCSGQAIYLDGVIGQIVTDWEV